MNPRLTLLKPYPFERLNALMQGLTPPAGLNEIALHIGEPKHPTPKLISDALIRALPELAKYPATAGLAPMRQSCADWLKRRYAVNVDPATQILPVNGSREALFAFVQAMLGEAEGCLNGAPAAAPIVVCPNPFYQIYEGAALLAGAEVRFANCRAPDFMPAWDDISAADWARTRLVFVCSPGNPTGAVMNVAQWQKLFALQDEYGFIIASDECYSEIYFDTPPLGALQAAQQLGRSFDKLMMFTSLSKRSNVPSMRSGFVAGDAALIKPFLLYRTYHGSAMSTAVQEASIAAWNDEDHVEANRTLYREKFHAVSAILREKYAVQLPDASFYLWLSAPDGDDIAFARNLWTRAAIRVLPGSLMARDTPQGNPGVGFVRIALVATMEECLEGARRMVDLLP